MVGNGANVPFKIKVDFMNRKNGKEHSSAAKVKFKGF